ncbi:MAG: hypothetical protein RQ745_14040 [Longimicrobiales bacterium]|nr:hypothetical protein [Longimicrobiales bacterium]
MKRVIWTIGMVLIGIAALVPGGEARAVQYSTNCSDQLYECSSNFECELRFGPGCSACNTQIPVLPGVCDLTHG